MKKYHDGDIVTGTVTGIEDYGIFISFDDNKSGLIHISELSDSYVKDVGDYAQVNDTITAKILSVDDEGHYKLSIKELNGKKRKNFHQIVETKTGFSTLKDRLPGWIDDTYNEIEKNKK